MAPTAAAPRPGADPRLPDFLIIGAMKCGTSTLQAQLAAQPGVFMTTPKEPNFFSDDDVHARGLDWYRGLFEEAPEGALKGEASTHYTKLPTHPRTLARMTAVLEAPRLVYMVRDPLERLISHYIHEWTMGGVRGGLEAALEQRPELVEYSRYARQIAPYVEAYGAGRICLTSLERLQAAPEAELARIAAFLGLPGAAWREETARENASADRLRRFPGFDLLVQSRGAIALRRALVPPALRAALRRRLQMRERPRLSPEAAARLRGIFAEDREALARLLPDAPDLSASYAWPVPAEAS